MRWRTLGLVIATLCACGSSLELPGTYAAPPEYSAWFDQVEACSGLARDLSAIAWQERAQVIRLDNGFYQVAGIDFPSSIWLATEYVHDERAVKHEMLHYLIGHPGHPTPPFGVCAFRGGTS